jgi:hypothetical protein
MKRLDCDEQSTNLKLPPCAGAFSTVVAKLVRLHHVEVPLVLTQSATDPDLITVAIPDPLPTNVPFPKRGVWMLTVQTDCGCYEAPVYIDCPPPAFAGVHEGTLTEASTECCIPEDALTFTVTSLSPPKIDTEGYPDSELLIDDGLAYAVRLGVTAPSVTYRWIDEDGIVLATGTYGALGTTEYHDLDLICATYALLPPVEPDND